MDTEKPNRKRKISRKADTRAANRLRVVNLQQHIGSVVHSSSPLSSSSTVESENEHDGEFGCDRYNDELENIINQPESDKESSITETQESSSCGSDAEHVSNSSEPIDALEVVDIEDLCALRDDNEERNAYILCELKKWAIRGVSCKKIDALLRVLQIVFPTLPRTYRTLLKTPRSTNLVNMGNGKFWYKGIGCSVVPRLSEKYLSNRESIQFDINIDGLELYPSSRDAFWPILGCLVDEKEPFIIAVYYGEGKPPLEPFLRQFVDELSNLMINGIMFQGTTYRVQVRNFVLDAPARAFIKCIKGHTSRKACEKCQNVSQVNSVPAPAVNIREQLAALKAQVSHPIKASKGNGINSNTKRKVLTAKKLIKAVNKKVSLEKSQSEDILRNCGKSPADTENANATDFSNADLHASKNLCQSPLNTNDMTSDSEMLPATQTSTESKISSSLHELGGERDQSEVFQSNNELSDSNDMQNLTKHRSAQQDLANRDNSVKRNTVKSFLRGSGDFSRKKRKGNDDKSTDRDVLDNIVKIQEEERIKLDNLELKLDRIIKKLFPEEIKLKRPHGIPAFSLRTEEEWEKLEEILADDDAFTYVVDVFAAKMKNKDSEVAALQSVLPKVITNSLFRSISWGGTQKTKIAFNKSKTYEAIQAAILQKFGKTVDLKKPEDYVKRWFSTSAQRVV
ncbi:uncharacterized protein [Temnothorax longispinosus]|uniref:uncharacterized protein n=1 Tax=Temnothorax longispinosus TaxID=300112 RepID=UPI003A995EFB